MNWWPAQTCEFVYLILSAKTKAHAATTTAAAKAAAAEKKVIASTKRTEIHGADCME